MDILHGKKEKKRNNMKRKKKYQRKRKMYEITGGDSLTRKQNNKGEQKIIPSAKSQETTTIPRANKSMKNREGNTE